MTEQKHGVYSEVGKLRRIAMATTIRGRTPNLNLVLFSVLILEP